MLLQHLLGKGRWARSERAQRLSLAFRNAGSLQRNAGVLFAYLCSSVPPVAEAVEVRTVCWRLVGPRILPSFYASWSADATSKPEEPALSPEVFESYVLQRASRLSAEELEHWFSHGCAPPADVGEQLAAQLANLRPRPFPEVLRELEKHPRLQGIHYFVKQLGGAIPLPPRRLAEQELPVGGYADVTTRGQPEHLLPSQFALDELEFVRRFAAKELLFFRREPPREKQHHELVVLFDQGVRTWGNVRMALAAAATAYARLAARRRFSFRLAATSNNGRLVDPSLLPPEALAQLLQASDLSANPGLALERLLEQAGPGARDIVLLTHPRNPVETDVQTAARRVRPGTRLFSLTLDAVGEGRLSELKHGLPWPVRQFRIDLERPPAERRPAPATPKEVAKPAAIAWTGDVEPFGFPFRLGNTTRFSMGMFAFDQSGEWLLARSDDKLLFLYKTDGSYDEILPRAVCRGQLLDRTKAVVGVAGGFAVISSAENATAIAHYDLAGRHCSVYTVSPERRGWSWSYFPEYHALVGRGPDGRLGLDLGTGESYPSRGGTPHTRAALAYGAAVSSAIRGPDVTFDPNRGTLMLVDSRLAQEGRITMVPLADGKPFLKDCRLITWKYEGTTLAVLVQRPGGQQVLHFLDVDLGRPRGQLSVPFRTGHTFALSPDGKHLARFNRGGNRLIVNRIDDLARPTLFTAPGKRHSIEQMRVEVGDYWLILELPRRTHLLTWKKGRLEHHVGGYTNALPRERLAGISAVTFGTVAQPVHGTDGSRWLYADTARLGVMVDNHGQVTITDAQGHLVCMIFAFRDDLAVCMENGVRCGPAWMLGGPETNGALEKIGQALLAATGPD